MVHRLEKRVRWSLLAMLTVGLASGVFAQVVTPPTGDLAKIDIVEHLGNKVPLDLQFTNEDGRPVTLRDYFGHGKPVLLMFGYYECPMLCNLVFNGVADGIRPLEWTPGRQFQVLTVSINPREKSQLAFAKKQNYLKFLGKPGADSGWSFLTGEQSQSDAFAQAVGFTYVFDSATSQYGHAAAAYVLTEDGVISRYLYGIEFNSRDLKFALLEASQGKIGTTMDRLLLYCYHYDPATKGYVLFAQNIMKLGGGLTLVALATLLMVL
ncbi:MAG: SCO family protein, partial [candidate division Zixibacteria bacterium]|nr:SCO family protein [candidate division Zixibacteria bacterium]